MEIHGDATHEAKPSASLLRQLIQDGIEQPVVFRGLISDWELLQWDLSKWSDKLGDKIMPFRSGFRKASASPQWERNCQMTHLTMKEFLELVEQDSGASNWFYFDYKYMNEWFEDNPSILEAVRWEQLGFPEIGGSKSTLWIGSDGAHTPCHYDTYGCNLVAQIFGTKQWVLFPPEKSSLLMPTRVPYEESSVYSKHNFYSPDVQLAESLGSAWVITLHPGEVLLVPRHWWHYVENIGTAISVNTWLPLPEDKESRLEEALVKVIISQLCKGIPDVKFLINPNEEESMNCTLADNVHILETCFKQCSLNNKEQSDNESLLYTSTKKAKLDTDENNSVSLGDLLQHSKTFVRSVSLHSKEDLKHILETKRARFKTSLQENNQDVCDTTFTIGKLINSLCHPDIINVVRAKFCEQCL